MANKIAQRRMIDPPLIEARPPGALRCVRRRCSFERREAIELVLSFQASLLSQVATRLSICPVRLTGSEVKTTELEKSYKRTGL
jgi:hypothetical protein